MKYQRILQKILKPLFFKGKALLIIGARQVGKTTLLQNLLRGNDSALWLNADMVEVRERLSKPNFLTLKGVVGKYKIVVIDEIQRLPNAGLLLKLLVDNFPEVQFIATGSSALEIADSIFEPMTGRVFTFYLYPFSLAELYYDKSSFEVEKQLPFHMVYGNYPEVVIKRDISETILINLAQQYLYKDVLVWKNIRKPDLLDKLLMLLSYQIGAEVSMHELAGALRVKSETVESYIDILEKSFVIYRLKSFGTNPRKEVSKMSKIFFWDNGIRNAVISDFRDLSLRNDHGQLFENFIISERLKMNAWLHPNIKSFFWRNYSQREVDYIELEGKVLSGFEMKWNASTDSKVTRAFTNLYPEADTNIISPANFNGFVGL